MKRCLLIYLFNLKIPQLELSMDFISESQDHLLNSQEFNSQVPVNTELQPSNIFNQIVDEVITQRSLLVLSKGMSNSTTFFCYSSSLEVPEMMAKLISRYSKAKDNSLTLILNLKKEEILPINEQLVLLGTDKIHGITNETTAKRTTLYISGGIYAVSNVILVMDLLQRAISPSIITTLIVNEAEGVDSILDDEAWAITMIRKENKVSFPLSLFLKNYYFNFF